MGAGRKTKTITVPEKSLPPWTPNSIDTARNLKPGDLAAVIFGCKHNTIEECFVNNLFGLPAPHYMYVRNINPGLPLFLFNYSDRTLHGIFEAASPGRFNINPQAWTGDASDCSPYPAQVKFRIRTHCQPLTEKQFGPIIAENYYGPKLFWFELDQNQTNKLIELFSSSPISKKQMNQCKSPFGSNAREKHQLERQINYDIQKQELKVACVKPNCGPSYSSVLKGMSSYAMRKDQSHVNSGTDRCESDKVLGVDATQKPWSALFNEQSAYDVESRAEHSKLLTLESNISHFNPSNLQQESSVYVDQKIHVSETPIEKEDSRNCGTVAAGDSSQGAEDQDNWQQSPSCVSPFSDEDSQNPKVPKDTESDCDDSLCVSMANTVIAEDNQEKVAEINSREATGSESQSSDICSVVSKLLLEVEVLKGSQPLQVQRISLLEQELVESRIEIQQLKDRCKMLELARLNFGELMFIAGGFDGSSWFSSLDAYSPIQDHKVPLAPMSSARSHASAVNLNGELYVFGGAHGSYCYNTVESYNQESNKWVSHPPLNQRKGHLAGVSLNNKIFALGGGYGDDAYAEVEMLDVTAERWIPIRSMFEKRLAPAAVEVNGIIYVVGGYNGNDFLNSVERRDPREHSWTHLKSMNSRRGFHSLAVLNGKIYALGGYDGRSMLSSVELFDPRLGSWMMAGSMYVSRGYFGALVMKDTIYTMGGLNEDGKVLDTVECYNESYGWRVTHLNGPGKRCFFSAVVL